ncbi:MAG: response regulator [Oscillospiraceae bacterium]|nr:response regulator [Oscillospiraceae bacterium]
MDKKVLLVADDDEMSRRIIGRFLKNTYEIVEAQDGRAALEVLAARPVDAMLLDIIMPEMDGLEALQAIREDRGLDHVAILVATSTKEKTERSALSLGADDVVSKPYDPLVIKKRLENIMATKELKRQKTLLQSSDFDAVWSNRIEEMTRQARRISDRIQSDTGIINANKENFRLVEEITEKIRAEANEFVALVEKQK